jgi:hypothetical protein
MNLVSLIYSLIISFVFGCLGVSRGGVLLWVAILNGCRRQCQQLFYQIETPFSKDRGEKRLIFTLRISSLTPQACHGG